METSQQTISMLWEPLVAVQFSPPRQNGRCSSIGLEHVFHGFCFTETSQQIISIYGLLNPWSSVRVRPSSPTVSPHNRLEKFNRELVASMIPGAVSGVYGESCNIATVLYTVINSVIGVSRFESWLQDEKVYIKVQLTH